MFLSYKRRFQTCLQMLDELRRAHPELKSELLSYAGVLDPMAEGWVSVLVGKAENQDRVRYTEALKEYEVEILVGVGTDSGDLMGIVGEQNNQITNNKFQINHNIQDTISKIKQEIESFPNVYLQKISRFANKKYKGKPLWWYQLNEVKIPEEALVEREVRILEREVLGTWETSVGFLADEIGAMAEVFGETFRMGRVVPSWEGFLKSKVLMQKLKVESHFEILKVRLVVSKGFFVRQWVQDLGEMVGAPMCVFGLKRTKVFGDIG